MNTVTRRILIVDDEVEFVKTIARHLRREGFLLDSALNGQLAQDKILGALKDGIPYHLVITDLIMPNMGAVKLLKWMRQACPEISVILVSGFGDTDLVNSIIRPGKDAYVQKPLIPKTMMKLISKLFQLNIESGTDVTKGSMESDRLISYPDKLGSQLNY